VVSLLLGAGVILVGLGYLGWLPLGRVEGAGGWVSRAMGWALKRGSLAGVLALGALNGLLPCGLVYASLLVAASTGGALQGAEAMAVFGLGTTAALVVVGIGAGSLSLGIRQTFARFAGALMVVVGLQLSLRGAAALGAVPHIHVGRLMLW
jgi:sulfite exporter TauE/SafE